MLLDEPFGALDPLVRKEIRTWLRALHSRLGLTSIFITHDQARGDRPCRPAGGDARRPHPPARHAGRAGILPADPFVFEFLGPTIRLEGAVQGGMMRAENLPVPPFRVTAPEGPSVALLRPHQLAAIPGEGDARVIYTRAAGPVIHITVEVSGRSLELLSTGVAPPAGACCNLVASGAKIFAVPGSAAGATPDSVAPRA